MRHNKSMVDKATATLNFYFYRTKQRVVLVLLCFVTEIRAQYFCTRYDSFPFHAKAQKVLFVHRLTNYDYLFCSRTANHQSEQFQSREKEKGSRVYKVSNEKSFFTKNLILIINAKSVSII